MKTRTTGLLMVVLMALSVVACSESHIEKTKTLALEPGGEFVLQSDGGSITVTGSSASGARIIITSNRDDLQSLYNFNFESGSGQARVTARRKWFQWFSDVNLHFDITVPTRTRISIQTGGGTVKASSLQGDQRLETSGGSVVASEIHGNVMARTSGGTITAISLDGSLEARTSGGSIHIASLTGHVSARTSGGSIHADLAQGNSQGGEVITSGGSIRVNLDPKANLNIEASTSGGSVSSDLPLRVQGAISNSDLHGMLGSGGPALILHTSGGSIHIYSN
jgi:Toastrack DUF4097